MVDKTMIAVLFARADSNYKALPDCDVWDKILALAGDVPRVELFARRTAPGWDLWGNEVECDLAL
jgi:N6-adenosine-specific RNA methylase IME4